jgi:hypothetical protein
VRNRHRTCIVGIAFVLASSILLLAQSGSVGSEQRDNFQVQGDPAQPLLTANLGESPAIGSINNEPELPDAPSTTKPDVATADPAASPAVKRDSAHGAPPAAMGGPLGVDRSVTDRNYLAVTGAMFGASIANAELTMHCFGQHSSCNDVPNLLSRRVALYGIGIPADFGVAYLTYRLKRKHNRMWYVPAAAVTGANLFFAVRVYRWSQDPNLPVEVGRRSIR